MALNPPAPDPVPSFAAGVWHWIDDNFIDPYRFAYNWVSGFSSVEDANWRYVVVTFSRQTPVGTVEDKAQIGLNIVNITNGDIDTSWDDGDFTAVNTALGTFLNAWQASASNTHTADEIRYYVRGFNPDLPIGQPVTTPDPATGKPYQRFVHSGTVERVYPVTKIGASSAAVEAYQVAMSITWRTAQRRHWGRIYLPGVSIGATSQFGRFNSATITTIANAAAELVDALGDAGFQLFVPTTQVGGKFHVAGQTITEAVVDDIPDVVRRRRPKQPSIKQVGVPT